MSTVHYDITPASLGGHRFDVRLTVQTDGEGLDLTLPTWIPGSYLVRDFSKHLGRVTAHCSGRALRVRKHDKRRWRVEPCDGEVVIEYEVYAHDLSVRGAHLDSTHGFFNGSSVFLEVEGREEQPLTVTIHAPTDEHVSVKDWRVATTLPRDGASEWGFGRFRVSNYAELIDHPVEMGRFDLVPFEVAGVPHYFVLSGRHHCDTARLADDAARICRTQVDLFGELPSMERYLFLTRVEGSGYGGLEHRASSALVCARDALPKHSGHADKKYRQFLGLVSHEYFHLWNVKRIKPAVFTPYALEGESYTELLWVFEGVTSYYDDLALVRSGVIDEKAYAELLSNTISRVRASVGHRHQSLAESSFDAWVKFYKPDENTPNAVVSYYAKGALVAMALDLTLRERGDATLDDVMRAMWSHYGSRDVGVPEDGFEEVVEQVSGLHLRPFFDAMVRDTQAPDLEALLESVGWQLMPASEPAAPITSLGVTLAAGSSEIKTVRRGSCAERAGLAAGDTLIAINGLRVADKVAALLKPYSVGDRVRVHLFRRDELIEFDVVLEKRPATRWVIADAPQADDRALASRALWLQLH
ncbi:MAG: PDZ domain-containing protein [Pseudomonadota bacterium]